MDTLIDKESETYTSFSQSNSTKFNFSLAASSYGWEPEGHEYRAQLPTDSRSPCPSLNALANHGWLPRLGKNIDLSTFQHAISGGYNYELPSMDSVFELASLVDLARYDDIEIDGSLSRNDIYFGDNVHFDPNIWAKVAKDLHLYDTLGSVENQYVTVEVAAKTRAARVVEAMRVNPSFNNSENAISVINLVQRQRAGFGLSLKKIAFHISRDTGSRKSRSPSALFEI
ncbi:Chloroperoxidase [Penicillium paradoxum]|uniref:Chloroperoxidase n=1 Tax=Penicillium paradoxum TaxID=176176 RepID=UPI0025488A57|nr:Chloroperoxidase [Penicillium paradoxum]KAJ5794339.1 Chloroperoxidase [Penicillium paradoxum]